MSDDSNDSKKIDSNYYNSTEYYRHMIQAMRDIDKRMKESEKARWEEIARKNAEEQGRVYIPPKEKTELDKRLEHVGDNPNALDNTVATILYIIVMVGGAIFNDRVVIWIVATYIWIRHICRMQIKRQKIIDEYNQKEGKK